ncbi:methionyl-tRNA formyltransferase [Cellulosilyticum ruminicola]|uniref:methionyl-tRNA formyltransferase n=1 Tax=Cellulosilyticum ruminicola TaxID=425254 RepID=UPI0006D19DEC|nr:methionyl-tRNA formyltransferase [Cellulosilyticum ruminicola]
MNVVFMGTPDFAVPTLEKLIEEGHHISAVVTQPDKPKGRGKTLTMTPVKEVALKHDIEVLQPVKVRGNEEFYNHILSLNPDIIVVVAFGQILPESILNIAKYGCINIHGSLLPKYRGAAPIQWAIINEEPITGVTIMYMDKGVDTGDMLLKREMPIEKDDTYASLHDKMKIVGANALIEALPMIEAGGKEREKQDDAKATHVGIIDKSFGEIKWNESASKIDAKLRGLNPWPGSFTSYQGGTMKVWKAEPISETTNKAPGTIIRVDKEGMVVQTGTNCLLIEEIQMPNKKRMLVSEYIKGNTLESGTVLGR